MRTPLSIEQDAQTAQRAKRNVREVVRYDDPTKQAEGDEAAKRG